MSYIDCLFDRKKDRIHVVGRDRGERYFTDYPASYVLYYDDPKGKFRSIHGKPVSRFHSNSSKEFRIELASHSEKNIYESSDINPIFRCLSDYYLGADEPTLHTAFFDIEVDFDPKLGYSRPDDPCTPITAITVYLDWLDRLVTFAIPPKGMSMDDANKLADEFSDTFMFDQETDLLEAFLELIEDADVLSGWNSEGYDIPYTVLRIARVLSKNDTRRLCLWNQLPKEREFERFGATQLTFDLVGRVHMDYMQLYRKYTYEERHSYSLDAILDYEGLGSKTAYDGTLDQLYNNDFKTFIEYNRQDVRGLALIDKKLKFLDLANKIAHENTVLLPTTMGAVAVTDQAIINEAHSRDLIVPNRKKHEDDDTRVAGAYVAHPKRGISDWVGSIDINSLYPSVLRALNMGPETIVGQLRSDETQSLIKSRMAKGDSFAESWEGLFGTIEYNAVMEKDIAKEITIDWEDGTSDTLSAAQVYQMIFESGMKWLLSANGTIFTYEFDGVIPSLLSRWYAERKELQKKMRECTDESEREYWDKRQLVKKINLNSLYGALLNAGSRFFDTRLGQSTTLTGRTIAKHMDAHTNECITGEYDHIGDAIIYGDTDSAYFSAWTKIKKDVESGKMNWDVETAAQVYDGIADSVNESFPDFMSRAFNCPHKMGSLIKCGRETVSVRGLFLKKKRYALLIVDNEGKRLDVDGKSGKVKPMGLDLKRSDTPPVVQKFLSEVLLTVLESATPEAVIEHIREFKAKFSALPSWEKGSPKRVNNLTKYSGNEKRNGKTNMPGHVRAAMNWNDLKKMNSDNYSMTIMDGMKVIVCKLKPNVLGIDSIAYPTDENRLPDWFKELPFNDSAMEATVIDKKLTNLLGVLEWDIISKTNIETTFHDMFELE